MHRASLAKNSIKVAFNKNGKAVPVKFPKKKAVSAYTRIYMKSDLLFTNIGGKAGSIIYKFLRYQTGMNGKKYYPITNEFLQEYKMCRQTKYIALKKLKKEGLVDVLDRSESKGGNLQVRLMIKENYEEEADEDEDEEK